MTASLRGLWLKCHRWTALGLGWLLIVSGLTGSLLVVARPLDRLLHPAWFVAAQQPAAQALSLEALRARLATEFGPKAAFSFRPPRDAGATLEVLVRGEWRGSLYLHPATGAEQGRRGEHESTVSLLHGLHSALWLEQTGKAILALAAFVYLLLAVSGIVLWWPRRWPPSLRIELGKGFTRASFDLHRIGGVVFALVLGVSIATGAYLAWRPIGGWISRLAGAPVVAAPKLPAGDGPAASLDALAAAAQAAFPDGRIGLFLYTPHLDRPLAVRMHVPDDPHPNGRSVVWLDPRSSQVLARHRWDTLDPGTRMNSIVYPLHTGKLGGVAGEAAVALLGLVLGALGGTGLVLWWQRRRARLGAGRRKPAQPVLSKL
ncbi:PepSY-associated TM helix domain-containing protein [Massilia sp. CFBP9012]|uniref:PepSY-associated TM helix domain-containing protein n=1 Tax=Massilia sp. CFBP9012 TaxID=3096531 RepID=UPI002A6B51C6|nr:PepSY-associated TM helix domain-containing protein [Massilia sp. CFBP9012]MDY0977557.1 PepSY-associated TM helix domain-containing protein [Massilia sp. CFBP9012]